MSRTHSARGVRTICVETSSSAAEGTSAPTDDVGVSEATDVAFTYPPPFPDYFDKRVARLEETEREILKLQPVPEKSVEPLAGPSKGGDDVTPGSKEEVKVEPENEHSCMTYSSAIQLLLIIGLFCMFRWGYECEGILAVYQTPAAIPTNITIDYPVFIQVKFSTLCAAVPNPGAAIAIMIMSVFSYAALSVLQCVLYRPVCSDSCCVC